MAGFKVFTQGQFEELINIPNVSSNDVIKFYDDDEFVANIIKTKKIAKSVSSDQIEWITIPTDEECDFITKYSLFRDVDGDVIIRDLNVIPILQPQMCNYNAFYIHKTYPQWEIVCGFSILKHKNHEAYLLELHFCNMNTITSEIVDFTTDFGNLTCKKYLVSPALTGFTNYIINRSEQLGLNYFKTAATIIRALQSEPFNLGNGMYARDGIYPDNNICLFGAGRILKFPRFLKELKKFEANARISERGGIRLNK